METIDMTNSFEIKNDLKSAQKVINQFAVLQKLISNIKTTESDFIKNEYDKLKSAWEDYRSGQLAEIDTLTLNYHKLKNQFESIYKNSRIGIVMINKNTGAIEQFNKEFENLTGRSRSELINLKIWEIRPTEKRKQAYQKFLQIKKNGKGGDTNLEFMQPDGSIIYVEFISRLVTMNNIEYIQGIVFDITARKKIEKTLIENELFLRNLVEHENIIIFIVDLDGKILYNNGLKVFRLNGPDLIGKYVYNVIDKENATNYMKKLTTVIESGKSLKYEDCVHWQEKTFYLNIYVYPLKGREGQVHSVGTIAFNMTDQRQAEMALHESEERFKAVFEGAKDTIFIKDKSFRYTHVNTAMEKLFNVPASDLIGKSDVELFGNEAAKHIRKADERVLRGEVIEAEETKSILGEKKTFHAIKTPIYDNTGEIVGVCGIARDITDRINAEIELRKKEERYDLATTAAKVGVWDWALETNDIYIDPKIKKFLGYEDHEILNDLDEWGKHVHPDYREQVKQDSLSYIAEMASRYQSENRMVHKDGSTRWILVSGTTICNKNNKPVRMIGTMADITERRRMGEALKISEQKYRRLYNDAPVGYHEIDSNGRIKSVNKTEAEMLGYTVEEMIGKYIWEFIAPAQKKLAQEMIRKKIRDGNISKGFERTYLCKNGKEIHVYIEDRLVFDENDNLIGIRSTVQDITERKQLEEELFKTRNLESLGTFAGGIAHDFNNILTGIMCNLSLAKMVSSTDTEELNNVLNETEYAAIRAKDLTQQLLTFSKGGAPVKKTVSIRDLIKESAGFVTSGSNVKCVYEIPDNLWPVEIDRGQMSQVISNLVINADQAMPAGGIIRICAENYFLKQKSTFPLSPGNYLKIRVIDKGVGIPEKFLSKIFDPYFTTKQIGSGLGLSIVFSIIKNHDGFITVDSKAGSGTTFEVYLPAAEKQTIQNGDEQNIIFKGHGKILLMDDEEGVRKAATKIIRHLGYSVISAVDGEEAIKIFLTEIAKGEPFDAVILDLTIPGGLGGKETVLRLLQIEPDAKVIVSSGYSDDSIMANCAKFGFSGVIAKPYRIHEMSKTLHNILNLK